jgi:branched-subunit amino acid ABC-type transport system permease component
MLTVSIVGQLVWSGLASASFSCLFAVAFALVLKVNHVWNFAQAGMIVVAYASAFVGAHQLHFTLLAAALGAVAVSVAFAIGVEAFGFSVLRRRRSPMLTFFIFALVLSELCTFLAGLVFGTEPTTLVDTLVTQVHLFGGVVVSDWDQAAVSITLAMIAGLALFLRFSRQGQHMIAVADNPALAELYGINRDASFRLAIAVAAVFVAVGVVLMGTREATTPSTAMQQLLIISVVATVLAGIGQVMGAALAAALLGVVQGLSIIFINARWQPFMVDVLMVLAVLACPGGIGAAINGLLTRRTPIQR